MQVEASNELNLPVMVMVKLQRLMLLLESVTLQVTTVVPTGYVAPDW